ncbi:outer membrane receptor protein involved in Fe transport [Sphingopyxis panaciterrae]|uniref:TonB-dependent receptor n=1 Tax=Sphingopyxis panaciterrae TaxID=363841 RepID=UPI0014214134|nr:TonB-dependent receptor [Sphingopyxis panaciterrae]NIJ39474.1 outer membrane receptor protein involved in Fe transport [Sphingopyxis panaciterrae]
MKFKALIGTSVLAMALATPAFAQGAPDETERDAFGGEIVVTAQRQSERLQDVPIAVSAFSAEALEAQQIENSSDLQLTLPNITFTKTNFTSSSFTIRGIGDLCVGVTCDQATAIHLNGSPLFQTRLFETEFFDLERVEVLRGPQGTLFGRSATSGVVNVITAKPKTGVFEAAADAEYGNYDAIKVKGMVNIPIGDTLAARVAGVYVKRDGYTKNLFDNSRIDGRDLYSVRGSLRWEPTDDTVVDLMGSYFREKDDRMRIQKQRCQRDPTGVLGCLNNRRDASAANGNATLASIFSSRELFAIQGLPTALALGSLYGTDFFHDAVVPEDSRTVSTAFTPEYFTSELTFEGRIQHNFGPISAQLSGSYQKVKVDSRNDYFLATGDRTLYAGALNTLAFFAANGVPTGLPAPAPAFVPGSAAYFAPIAAALIPNGPNGPLCTSDTDPTGLGAFGGNSICSAQSLQYDRSNQINDAWSAELIFNSDFDGMFNFLVGGIYARSNTTENSYYVNAFGLDYASGILGSFSTFAAGLPPSSLGQPFFRNNTSDFSLKSYGLFGETYFEFNDRLKLTLGLRYNNDKKYVQARSILLSSNGNLLVPYGQTGSIYNSPLGALFDADPFTTCTAASPVGAVGSAAGCEAFQERTVGFNKLTGRAVIDFKVTEDNLLYASYSRGYKSGGINPPLQASTGVQESFRPEQVDAFEIGSKNTFGNGALQLNLTAFYYKYKDLQLSRIVSRTAVNDNINANIWGAEVEAIIRPDPNMLINIGFSYLKSKVSGDSFFSDTRDFGGGRSDAVIIKDISNAANCAVASGTAGNAAGVNAFVAAVNGSLGLRAPTAFPADGGIASTGAYSICSILASAAVDANGNPTPTALAFDPNGIQIFAAGIPVNIKGNELPQAPNLKFSVGAQYKINFQNDMSLVPRVDMAYTGESFGTIFNGNVNKIKGYAQVNAQIQLNGADDRWYVRGFVQNLFDSNSTTGLYVTDQSSGLFTNIFTLEPRRYGIGIGAKF